MAHEAGMLLRRLRERKAVEVMEMSESERVKAALKHIDRRIAHADKELITVPFLSVLSSCYTAVKSELETVRNLLTGEVK